MFRLGPAIVLLTLITMCFGAVSAQVAPQPSQPEKTSGDYRSGFMDGCMHATTGLPQNGTRFNADVAYHEGWTTGFKNCYPHQTLNTNNDPNGPLKGLF